MFFAIASIILFPCWVLLIGVDDWFTWIKVLSIAAGIIVLSLLRTTKWGDAKLCQWVTYLFLVVNILEAVARDAQTGGLANYLNATAGILLIVTLAKVNTIHIDTVGKYKDLYWSGMTLSWIIGYTLWNWVFVYLTFGVQSSMQHIAVLASALSIAFVNKERWLQARVFTLGIFFIMFHSFPHLKNNLPVYWYNEQFGFFISLMAFGFMLAYTIFFIRRTRNF